MLDGHPAGDGAAGDDVDLERILGLSKLTRLVRLFACRFSVQERTSQQLADGLKRIPAPHGVAVHWEAGVGKVRRGGLAPLSAASSGMGPAPADLAAPGRGRLR